jgi:hypothetical protein
MSSVGGEVLYVYTSCEMIGPRVDCSACGGREDEDEAEGLERNYPRGERIKNAVK